MGLVAISGHRYPHPGPRFDGEEPWIARDLESPCRGDPSTGNMGKKPGGGSRGQQLAPALGGSDPEIPQRKQGPVRSENPETPSPQPQGIFGHPAQGVGAQLLPSATPSRGFSFSPKGRSDPGGSQLPQPNPLIKGVTPA
ncbi:uncharacterized protein LOC119571750, partial [Penaeus monodon]|uniref:uncharacterized protein LOC119571750 n=1 Tax=Penaeus monodon TaxID=6687 RepID=UPI0018A79D87